MFTRYQYAHEDLCDSQQYYGQLVADGNAMDIVSSAFTKEELQKQLKKDEHLNGIPLWKWDVLGTRLKCDFEKYGDWRTRAGVVCVLKAAARMYALSE